MDDMLKQDFRMEEEKEEEKKDWKRMRKRRKGEGRVSVISKKE